MMLPDLINASFEAVGGVFVFNHCRVLWRDKKIAGVSKLSTAVFFAWGVWNLFYYPSLDQWMSFYGGIIIVAGNCLWLGMMIYFSRYPGGKCPLRWRDGTNWHCARCQFCWPFHNGKSHRPSCLRVSE